MGSVLGVRLAARPNSVSLPAPFGPGRSFFAWKQRTRKTVPVQPETHYARSGDVSIAYQIVGMGPFDLGLECRTRLATAHIGNLQSSTRLLLPLDPIRQTRHRERSASGAPPHVRTARCRTRLRPHRVLPNLPRPFPRVARAGRLTLRAAETAPRGSGTTRRRREPEVDRHCGRDLRHDRVQDPTPGAPRGLTAQRILLRKPVHDDD